MHDFFAEPFPSPRSPSTRAATIPGSPKVSALTPPEGVEFVLGEGVDPDEVTIATLSQLSPGTLITLDREAHEPVDVLVSGRIIAHGEVVTIGQNYGVRITSVQGS